MMDIVDKLRSGYAGTNMAHHEAADEIERNRAAILELVDALEGAKEMVCEWAAYADYKSQAKWDLIGDLEKLEWTIKKYQNPTKEY